MAGDPKFIGSQHVPDFPYAGYAHSLGLGGVRIDQPEEIGRAWDQALAADRPFVIEFVTDPEVPPLPPHINFEQAVKFWQSIFRGDPAKWRMIKQSFKDMAESYLPRRGGT